MSLVFALYCGICGAAPLRAGTATSTMQAHRGVSTAVVPHAYPGGAVLGYGFAQTYGADHLGLSSLSSPVTAMASSSDGKGYWLASADGGVYALGDALYYGSASTSGVALFAPIIAMAATPDGKGYWLLGQDGGVFAFGDAGYYGSTRGIDVSQPVVRIASTADGYGYWIVSAGGGVYCFGDAGFYGSAAGVNLAAPIVGIAVTFDGGGYWLADADGGVLSFGDAPFYGSAYGFRSEIAGWLATVVDIARTTDGGGYLLADSSGGVYGYGDAQFLGSTAGNTPTMPISDIVTTSQGVGYWLVDRTAFRYGFTNPATPSPIPQARAIVRVAEDGVLPNPGSEGINCNPYGPCEEWCTIFSTWVWQQAGVGSPIIPDVASVYTWAAAHGEAEPSSAMPMVGDIIMYGKSEQSPQHTGVVVQVWPNGAVVTIEGDSGPGLPYTTGVAMFGPFLPGYPWAFNNYPVYGYSQPTP